MRAVGFGLLLTAAVVLSGCQLFQVYRIDLPQGTPITQQQASQIQAGMNQEQVLYLLGSPAMRDTLAPNRWDYVYDYTAGTEGKRAKKDKDVRQFFIYFDQNGRVAGTSGADTLPIR